MSQPGFGEKPPRRATIAVIHQDAARQYPERALDHAHVLVQHQMKNPRAVQQRADRRHQHKVVGPDQFAQPRILPRLQGIFRQSKADDLSAARK